MTRKTAATVALIVLVVAAVTAQRGGRRGGFGSFSQRPLAYATVDDFDGSFQFCRVVFRGAPNGDGGGWNVDFPRADENLSIRLSELTKTPVGMDADGTPRHVLVSLRDAEPLSHCAFIMMTEVGALYLDDEEAATLHDYYYGDACHPSEPLLSPGVHGRSPAERDPTARDRRSRSRTADALASHSLGTPILDSH